MRAARKDYLGLVLLFPVAEVFVLLYATCKHHVDVRAQTNVLRTYKFNLPIRRLWRCSTGHILTSEIRGYSFCSFLLRKRIARGPININWTGLGCRNNLCKFINWGLFTSKQFVDEVSGDSGAGALRAVKRGRLLVVLWWVWYTRAHRHTQLELGDTGRCECRTVESLSGLIMWHELESTIRNQVSGDVFRLWL